MTLWNNNNTMTPMRAMMVLLAAGLFLIVATPSHAQQKQMKDESVVDQLTDTVSEVADEVSEVAGDVVEEVSEVAGDVVEEVSEAAEDVAEELSTMTDDK